MVTRTVKRIRRISSASEKAAVTIAAPVENRHTHQPLKLNNDSCGEVRMETATKDAVDNNAQISNTHTRVGMGVMNHRLSPHKKVAFPLREDEICPHFKDDGGKNKCSLGEGKKNTDHLHKDNGCRGDDFSDLGIFHKSRAEVSSKKNQRHIGNYDHDDDTVKDCASASAVYDQSMQAEQRSHASSKEKLDLTGIPEQPLILKYNSHYHDRGGALLSKYAGVTWINSMTKWEAQIRIHGEMRHIGYYDNEEDAAKDFARASYKYKSESINNQCAGSNGIECLKSEQRSKASQEKIDLTYVPKQWLIMNPNGKGNSSSKYKGVAFFKERNKWRAEITIDGTNRHVGIYDNEEDAATDYARAVLGGSDGIERQMAKQREKRDLTDVPKQQLIMKPNGKGSSTSMYHGVSLHKASNKWRAHIRMDGKQRYIGSYDNEEDAAADYARAFVKNNKARGSDGIKRLRVQLRGKKKIDLSDVPKQQLIMKPSGKGNSSSMYKGVTFHKMSKKWLAKIRIDGTQFHIGSYDKEEDAAADYARAFFKNNKARRG